MRINHNIAALNTYRQLGANGANTQKNLEKLSSGLRINRAGDDAAGLAISEKMRAQIRGLDTASRNAQDGISLIQTAEGALGEVHEMLKNMRDKMVQSANDPNTAQDRSALQDYVNQLTSEINRIGNSTEFNTQKLLNGGPGSTRIISTTVEITGASGGGAATGTLSGINAATASIKAGTAEIGNFTTVTNSKKLADDGAIGSPLTEMRASVGAGTVDINKAVYQAGVNSTVALNAGDISGITIQSGGGQTSTFTADFTSAFAGLSAGAVASATVGGNQYSFLIGANTAASRNNLMNAIKADITAGAGGYNNYTAITAAQVTAGAGDGQIVFSANAVNTDFVIGTLNVAAATDNTAAEIAAKALTGGRNAIYTFEVKKQFTAGDTINVGGQTFTARAAGAAGANEFNIGADIAATVNNLQAKLQAHASIGGGGYTVTASSPSWAGDTNSITISRNTAGVDAAAANFSANLTVAQTAAVKGQYKFEIASNFEAGQKITIAGQEFEARASGVNNATGFVIGADINATAANLLTAINANATLAAKFDTAILQAGNGGAGITGTTLATDADTLVFQEKAASGNAMATAFGTVVKSDQAAVTGKYSFEITKNFSAGDTITIGSKVYTAKAAADATGLYDFAVGGSVSATATNLAAKITANDGTYTAATGNSTFINGNKITLTEVAASGTDLAAGNVTRTKVAEQAGVFEFLVTNNFASRDTINIGGVGLKAGTDFNVGADINATAANIAAAIAANATLGDRFTAVAASDKITLTEKVAKATGTALAAPTVTFGAISGKANFDMAALKAGSEITIDGEKLTLATGGTAAATATELKSLIQGNGTLNAKYSVVVADSKVTLTQKAGSESATAPNASYKTQAGSGYTAKLQIGANYDQSMTVDIGDMRSQALSISGTVANATITASDGAKATLVAVVSATNGTSDIATEYTLDVSTNEKATAAISVMDDAINAVSTQRSKLGAFQNRLEHTINNLGTTSENLTASESRIRDVDMAKEMMEFTKNNILSQAAQAMLAQANQQPQGVLQLLR